MTLKEKFLNSGCEKGYINLNEYRAENNVKIAEDFAIRFAIWKEMQATQDDNGFYYGESRIGVSRENPVDIHQLLEIYKEQKQLLKKYY